MRGIEGKVALVTGAACPPEIGRATALRLAASGAAVVCADRIETLGSGTVGGLPDSACTTGERLRSVASDIAAAGGRAVSVDCDVADDGSVGAAVLLAVSTFGRLDLVVNVQGGLGPSMGWGDALDLDVDSWRRSLEVNLTGAFVVAQAAARQMRAQGDGGSIVLLSSFATVAAKSGIAAFAAAKAGVDRLAAALAQEWAVHGIRVNAVRPLGVDPAATTTGHPFLDDAIDRSGGSSVSPDTWVRDHIALGRLQHPDETAAVIEFLLSDEASFVTGECVTVAGGGRM